MDGEVGKESKEKEANCGNLEHPSKSGGNRLIISISVLANLLPLRILESAFWESKPHVYAYFVEITVFIPNHRISL